MDEYKQALYVVARKLGDPATYYYRTFIDSSRWTAWTKIDVDIASDHILPLIWNRRFYLFWAIINRKPNKTQDKPAMTTSGGQPPDTKTHLEVQLAWSEFKDKKWLAKQTAPQTLVIPLDIEPYQVALRSTIDDPYLHIDLFSQPYGATQHCAGFVLGGVGNKVEAFVLNTNGLSDVGPETRGIGTFNEWSLGSLALPADTKFDAMAIVPWDPKPSPDDPRRPRVAWCSVQAGDPGQRMVLMSSADFFRLIVPHQIKDFDSSMPFFYEDPLRSYFIVPTLHRMTTEWAEYAFYPFYHAFMPLFIRELNRGGVDGLFARDLQLNPTMVSGAPAFDLYEFINYYRVHTETANVYPNEAVDFEPAAGYAIYNWEIFFHIPLLIGESLSLNQQFEDAKHWYEHVFNPTSSTPGDVPARYWVTKPFYKMTQADYLNQSLQTLMDLVHKDDVGTVAQIDEWRRNPFDPHVIAGLRPVVYQRTMVMKYIDNLIAWGDHLFTQDTMESINEATQMYVLAAELLGPRPSVMRPLVVAPDKTYAELEKAGLDDFANARVLAAENLLGPVHDGVSTGTGTSRYASGSGQGGGAVDPNTPKLPSFDTLYFSIPPNHQLLGYWDTVADRLLKIRHGLNIEGVKRQLALFAPPINPALLVKAAAAGLDLGSILSDMSAALPPYRFRVIIQEAIQLCEMVRGFGNQLLGVLEKSDAEALALQRSGHERRLQEQITAVMQQKLDEANQQIDILAKQRQAILERQSFYSQRKDEITNTFESAALVLQGGSLVSNTAALMLQAGASVFNLLPTFQFGASGAGGSPHTTVVWGSSNIGSSAAAMSSALGITSSILQTMASMSQTIAAYQRRREDWELQYKLATDEISANDSQSLAAAIRRDIAQKELANHSISVQMTADIDDFLHSKYTNRDLYNWMVAQTSAVYFQTYQLSYTLAKRAEQCFRRELGLDDSSYIQFGYWDSLKKGLLAGDKLAYDLQRLKSAYYAQDTRRLELTKHISLLMLDPSALVKLRTGGECTFTLPEILFDLDNPGHYTRRIKSVGVSLPSVVGPYTGVSMTLTLQDNHVRTDPNSSGYDFYPENTDRFADDQGGDSAIVTSSAQNDRGVFDLKLDDERYLPFEFTGAVSTWTLRLNPVYPQFDYSTISDVIIHLQFTARDGGDDLRDNVSAKVRTELNAIALAESRKGLYRLISARHEFATSWQKFLNPGSGQPQVLAFDIPPERFPFFTGGMDIKIKAIDFYSKLVDPGDYSLVITPPGGSAQTVAISAGPDAKPDSLHTRHVDYAAKVDLGTSVVPKTNLTWSFQLQKTGAADFSSLAATEIDDLLLVVQYEVA